MSDATAETLGRDEMESEREGWSRLMSLHQGKESGWDEAAKALRESAGPLFVDGNDREARSRRDLAEWLEKHPKRQELRVESQNAYRQYLHFGNLLGLED
jgi:hypothetical protein